jgi:sulfide:quinone oxidoreductase
MSDKTVLVLGGGVGGIVAARRLRSLLPASHRIRLIERAAQHVFQPSLLWLMIGEREPGRIQRPLEPLNRKGIEVERGVIEEIDAAGRAVRVGGRELVADALIVSLGADLVPGAVPGLADAGYNLYSLEGAVALRDALRQFHSGRIVVLTAAPAYKCPAAPYEAVMLIEYYCRQRGIRDRVEISLYAAEPGPMGVAGPEVSAAVRGLVGAKGIAYYPEHHVAAVLPADRRISFANGVQAEYDLLVFVPPHRVPAVVQSAGLVGESGWVPVDPRKLETTYPSVFAIGDVTSIPLTLGKPLPKAGVFAERQAEVVARNLAARFQGKAERESFDGWGACFVETGDGKAAYGAGNFYAEPAPQIKLRRPGRGWHVGKVLFEKVWLRRWYAFLVPTWL